MAQKYTTTEGEHIAKDGKKLYTKRWTPIGPIRARMAFVHGWSDHCNAYYTFFPNLASRGVQVLAYDQRGWGRSVTRPSERGLTGPTSQVLDDLSSFLAPLLPPPTPYSPATSTTPPLFLMGHSMGGAEILTYALTGPRAITRHIVGYLAEAPYLALHAASRPARGVSTAGKLSARLSPHTQITRKLDERLMCRDVDVQKAFAEDELCHDTGTLEALRGMMERGEALIAGKLGKGRGNSGEAEEMRIWVGHGTGDKITDYETSRRWFVSLGDVVKDKEFKTYEGWYHKLHAEPGEDKYIFANDVAEWIFARIPGGSQAETGVSKARL